MDLGPRQRENLSKTLFDVGKLVLAFNVLSPMAAPGDIRISLAIGGLVVVVGLFMVATKLDKGR